MLGQRIQALMYVNFISRIMCTIISLKSSMGTLSWFPIFLQSGTTIYDSLCSFPEQHTCPKWGLLLKERRKFFSLRVSPI